MLNILEKAGSYEILQSLSVDDRTFAGLIKRVSRETLANRLKEFEKLSYVSRRVEMIQQETVTYTITEKGREALREFIELQLISERPE